MSDNPVFDRIRQEIGENAVVLYMKGTPIFPQCGFSAAVVQVLSELEVKFKGVDVLMDPSLRDGIISQRLSISPGKEKGRIAPFFVVRCGTA